MDSSLIIYVSFLLKDIEVFIFKRDGKCIHYNLICYCSYFEAYKDTYFILCQIFTTCHIRFDF